MAEYPDFHRMNEVRFKLTECLSGMRALDECIAQCFEEYCECIVATGCDPGLYDCD